MNKDFLAHSVADIARLREAVFYVGVPFIQPDSTIVDLGCGYGDAIAPFIGACDESNSFLSLDASHGHLEVAKRRFTGLHSGLDHRADFKHCDLTSDYPGYQASLTLAACLLQHISIPDRWRVLRSAYHCTIPGGAIIVVERVISPSFVNDVLESNNISQVMRDNSTYDLEKLGFSVTAAMTEQWIKEAGFRQVECFYRLYNYAAWIAVKDE